MASKVESAWRVHFWSMPFRLLHKDAIGKGISTSPKERNGRSDWLYYLQLPRGIKIVNSKLTSREMDYRLSCPRHTTVSMAAVYVLTVYEICDST